jgi:type VI secretion system secreted protein Hcp
MALDAFLDFGGKIKGSVKQQGREGKVRVFGVDHLMAAVTDGATGFPTKTVMPGALVATKSADLASAPLQKAMQEGTVFDTVRLEMWRMPPTGGVEENHYTMVLTDAQVKSIRTFMRFNKPADDMLIPEVEEVALSYKAISFSYKSADGNNSAGPFLRDKFDDSDDSMKLAIQKGVAGAAKALGTQIGAGLKDALKQDQQGEGGDGGQGGGGG